MTTNIADQQQKIESVMRGLMKELEKLAPHPSRPDYTGPLFTQINSEYKPPAEYDGMLGSLMLEGMLGTAFAEASTAANNNTQIGWTEALDLGSEYIKDRQTQPFQIGQKRAIAGRFNKSVAQGEMMKAYLHDLPRRMGIERWLAHYQRYVYGLKKQARLQGLSVAL